MSGPKNAVGKHVLGAMRRHDEEIGQKLALSLAEYHTSYVVPLEARIVWLETPWYRKALFRVKHWFGKTWKRPTD